MKCISNTDIEKRFSVAFKLGMDTNGKQEKKNDGLVCEC